jgi:hypothetical protein
MGVHGLPWREDCMRQMMYDKMAGGRNIHSESARN